jgi:hypothetical protein
MARTDMLLIGSKSLVTHVNLDRQPADWDLIVSPRSFNDLKNRYQQIRSNFIFIEDQLIELHLAEFGSSNGSLLDIAQREHYPLIDTPVGLAHNACLSMHKLLKLSSHDILFKHKNYRDLKLLDDVEIKWPDLLEKRRQETQARNAKRMFFADRVTRYVDHDLIHSWVAQALGLSQPTFASVVVDGVAVSPSLFAKASDHVQLLCLVEETLALSLERWFIPNVSRRNVFWLWDKLLQAQTSQDPCIRWLDKLCCAGALHNHPDWLAQWGHNHYAELRQLLQQSLIKVGDRMPQEFWHLISKVKRGQMPPLMDR